MLSCTFLTSAAAVLLTLLLLNRHIGAALSCFYYILLTLFFNFVQLNAVNGGRRFQAHPLIYSIDEILILPYLLHQFCYPVFVEVNLVIIIRVLHIIP